MYYDNVLHYFNITQLFFRAEALSTKPLSFLLGASIMLTAGCVVAYEIDKTVNHEDGILIDCRFM
jgi:hypothetical protein